MKKVSIRTAQNIIIDFQVASLLYRVLAFAIDLSILVFFLGFIGSILIALFPAMVYVLPVVFFLYTPVCETFMNGQTFGKRAMKIKVVNVNGKEPALLDIWIRWSFRLIDIYFSLGALAVIFISTTARGQRLGGILSNTMVVSLTGEMGLKLNDILQIEDRSKYQPKYSEAFRFSEDEMLTVKAVIDRYGKYRNESHQALLELSAQRCATVLGLGAVPDDSFKFLKTLLRDYIVITRS